MSKPKPGDEITYTSGRTTNRVERTGIVLDMADAPGQYVYDRKRDEDVWRYDYFAVWVHREDGTFDKVQVFTRGGSKGRTIWLGHYTAGGIRLDDELISEVS